MAAEKRGCADLGRILNVKDNTAQRRFMIPPRPGRRGQPLPSHAGRAQDSQATPLGIDRPEACAHLHLNDST